jgi:hypothetical protein
MSFSHRAAGTWLAVATVLLVAVTGCAASDEPAADAGPPDTTAEDRDPATSDEGDLASDEGVDPEPEPEPGADEPPPLSLVDVADVDEFPELVEFADGVGLPVFVPLYDEEPATSPEGHPLVTTTMEAATARAVASLLGAGMQGSGWETFGFPPDEDGVHQIRASVDDAEVTYRIVEDGDGQGRVETVVVATR